MNYFCKYSKPSPQPFFKSAEKDDSDFLNIKKMSSSAEKEMNQTIHMTYRMNKFKGELKTQSKEAVRESNNESSPKTPPS